MRIIIQAHLAARCNTCSFLTPLPGLRHKTECASCAAPIDVAAKIRDARVGGLTYTFGGYYDALAEASVQHDEGDLKDARDSNGTPLKLRSRKQLDCRCGAPLEPPTAHAVDVRCAKCGDATPVRWPDDQTREWDPRITYVIGDAGDRGIPLKPKLEGTVAACGSCGAPLVARDGRRVLACSHCRAENFLSDAMWTKLHPRPEDHAFYLVYEL